MAFKADKLFATSPSNMGRREKSVEEIFPLLSPSELLAKTKPSSHNEISVKGELYPLAIFLKIYKNPPPEYDLHHTVWKSKKFYYLPSRKKTINLLKTVCEKWGLPLELIEETRPMKDTQWAKVTCNCSESNFCH